MRIPSGGRRTSLWTRARLAVLLLAVASSAAFAAGAPNPSIGPNPNVGPNAELGSEPPSPGTAEAPPAAKSAPPPAPRAKGSKADYEFAVDSRIELLAAVVSVARPEKEGARPEFAALKDQPAVKRLRAALERGAPEASFTQLLLSVGDPPELLPRAQARATPFGLGSDADPLLAELRDFARAADWTKVWKSRAAANAAMVARAQAETSRTLSPEAVEAWFGTRFKDRYRFLLSDDLPAPYGANASLEEGGKTVEVRLRSTMGWKDKNAYFSFDDFAGSAAHELTHTLTDPIVLTRKKELGVYASLMVPGCTDSWTGCVLEHVNIAATLRALRAESGEEAYRKTLKDYAGRGFPYLPALCERLAEFEAPAVRAKGFAAFFPRVEDVFREALRGKFKAQAQSNVAASAAAAAPAKEPFSEEFGSDPRLELAAVLHRLAASPEKRAKEAAAAPDYAARLDARFLAYATQPAVALTAKLEGAEGTPGLPAILIVHLSTGPELARTAPVPSGYAAAAGGDEALEAWFAAVRKFARASGFFGFYESERDHDAVRVKEARAEAARALPPTAVAAYLGKPLEGKRVYALSPLYPSSYPGRLTVFASGGARTLRARAAHPGPKGTAAFDLDSDRTSTAAELIYDEAARLVPGGMPFTGSLAEACADRRGPGWPVCESEHLAAAVRLRVRRAAPEKELVGGALPLLPYLPALLEKLRAYEAARSTYPALADFWPEAEKAFGPRKASAAESEADLAAFAEFSSDLRVELVAVLLRLGGAARGKSGNRGDEERLADQRFTAFASHPAVLNVSALSKGAAGSHLPLRLALALDSSPGLEERGLPPEPWLSAAGGAAGFRAYAQDLRAFVKDAKFASYYDAARPLYRRNAAEARAEALREESPRAALAYLGAAPPRARFLLSGLLQSSAEADFEMGEGTMTMRTFVRPAAEQSGPPRFRFDSFGDSVVYELVRTLTDPLVPAGFTVRGPVPKGCAEGGWTPTWRACAQEHLAYAVTLRLLAADAGEPAARIQTVAYSGRGLPRLPQLTEMLKKYEKSRGRWPKLAGFAPELLEVFRSPSAEIAAAPEDPSRREPFSESFGVDPRLELASVLHRLAAPAEVRAKEAEAAPGYAARVDARFLAFAEDPAAPLTARLEAAEGTPGLPADLIVHLSTGADLAQKVAVPPGYIAAAGGDESLAAWFAAVREFARASGFFKFYESERGYYAALEKEAKAEAARAPAPAVVAAYLGRPLEGARVYALSPLYPPSYPTRLTVFGADGTQVLRARAASEAPRGGARFDLDSDKASTAAELIYDEAARLTPGVPAAGISLSEACADRRGPGWPICEREHLAAAVRLRARGRGTGAEADEEARASVLPYLPALLGRLAVYETSRSTYPALADFWPEAETAFGPRKGAAAETESDLAAFADFGTDPRVELISVLLRLGGSVRSKEEARNEEEKLADQRFAAFSSHPAVAKVVALARDSARLPLRLALELEPSPEPAMRGLPPEPWLSAAGGPAGFRAFAADLRSFAHDAGFAAFYEAARPLYRRDVAEARAEALREESPRAALSYLGASLPRARFLLSALLPASARTDFELGEGTASVRTFVRPAANEPGAPRFRFDSFDGGVVHELVRALADPLVPAGFAPGGPAPKGCADDGGVPSWRACAREHLTYAVTLRLLAADEGEDAARIQTAAYVARGYPRLPELTEKLKNYEKNRRRWPKFEVFASELLGVFASTGTARGGGLERISSQDASAHRDPDVGPDARVGRDSTIGPNPDAGPNPALGVTPGLRAPAPAPTGFAGGIADAIADPAPCALILPSTSAPELAEALARLRRERRLCDETLTGERALKLPLKGRVLIAVGSPERNVWLKAHWDDLQLPARLEGGRLRMEGRADLPRAVYEGKIGFVSVARNPEDPARPLLVLAADDPELPTLLRTFGDGSDYEIRSGEVLLKAGTYEKSRLPWRAR